MHDIAKAMLKYIKSDEGKSKFFEVASITKIDQLETVINSMVVHSTSDILRDKNGNEKTMINYYEDQTPQVRINQGSYQGLETLIRHRLVFHELLCLLGLESSDHYEISNRLTELFERPIYVSCNASQKDIYCNLNFSFDTATHSLKGAYACQRGKNYGGLFDTEMLLSDELFSKNATWKAVKIWADKSSYSAGFEYQDSWFKFTMPSAPMTGMRLSFRLEMKRHHFDKPSTTKNLNGFCTSVYR